MNRHEASLTYEVFEDREISGQWRVEAIDHDSEGECYVTIFAGPDSEQRARVYAEWVGVMGAEV